MWYQVPEYGTEDIYRAVVLKDCLHAGNLPNNKHTQGNKRFFKTMGQEGESWEG